MRSADVCHGILVSGSRMSGLASSDRRFAETVGKHPSPPLRGRCLRQETEGGSKALNLWDESGLQWPGSPPPCPHSRTSPPQGVRGHVAPFQCACPLCMPERKVIRYQIDTPTLTSQTGQPWIRICNLHCFGGVPSRISQICTYSSTELIRGQRCSFGFLKAERCNK